MRQHHADGNALAMHEAPAVIVRRRLQRVAERMAEIEQRPRPLSRSSAATTWAFARQLVAIAMTRSSPPENTAVQFCSSHSKNSGRSISPYLATSA